MRRGRTPFDSAAAVAESARGVESDAMVMTDPKLSSNGVELGVQHPELPNHYAYIYKFRVEQCPLFLQHKCTSHRPFTCFHWHFQNQRRRKPVRRRDGTLNYSADEYCTRYDETTGLCQDGDDCPYLHRTAGDTERRYHLRYYKTAPCVHETDARGFCVKNGVHCAFAHGNTDLRNPVYDIRDLRAKENGDCDLLAPNALDKERSLLNDDPKWQDTSYVLANYKTEPCKKPPRLCRQGYACPQYHNSRDRRRSPKKFKYRSTPCPNAKHGEEWGDPTGCENGDMCQYCHTRTEQQFHPEIYKSTKCHDMQTNSYCPRGSFCAFAHGDFEVARESGQFQEAGTNFADLLSSALPSSIGSSTSGRGFGGKDDLVGGGHHLELNGRCDFGSGHSPPGRGLRNGFGSAQSNTTVSSSVPIQTAYSRLQSLESAESTLASSGPTVGAIGSSLGGFGPLVVQPIGKPRSLSVPGAELSSGELDRMISLDRDDWAEHASDPFRHDAVAGVAADARGRKSSLYGTGALGGLLPPLQPASYFSTNSRLSNSKMSSALSDVDDSFKEQNSSREYEAEQPSLCESIAMGVASSGLLVGGSAPVNIPRTTGLERHHVTRLTPSPPAAAPLHLLSGIRVAGVPVHAPGPLERDSSLDSASLPAASSLFFNRVGGFGDWGNHQISPSNGNQQRQLVGSAIAHSPLLSTIGSMSGSLGASTELQRLREEVASQQVKMANLEESLSQARKACDAWRCKALLAEQQRDEAVSRIASLQSEVKSLAAHRGLHEELRNLPL